MYLLVGAGAPRYATTKIKKISISRFFKILLIAYSRIRHALRSGASTHSLLIKHKYPQTGVFLFWWKSACTNRAENKQDFTDLMQQVKLFKTKLF